MILETSIAVNYLQSHLYSKLPRRRVDCYGEELEKYLHKKIQSHWFPDDPQRDSSNRCIHTNGPRVDQCLIDASIASGLDWNEIRLCLPPSLKISIDPGHVSVQYSGSTTSSMNDSGYFGTKGSSGNVWQNGSSCASSSTSSGCSSASSESSSNNGGSTTPQTMKQVLYSDGVLDLKKNGDSNNKSCDTQTSIASTKPWPNSLENESIEKAKEEQHKTLFDKPKKHPILQQDEGYSEVRNFLLNSGTSAWMNAERGSSSQMVNGNTVKTNNQLPYNSGDMNKTESSSRFMFLSNNNSAEPMGDVAYSQKNQTAQQMSFTAAMFAQTKFGSTKLKTHNKRNKKIVSPGEGQLSNGLAQDDVPYMPNMNQRSNDPSAGRQEALREALQQQQQLLNAAEYHSSLTSGSSPGPSASAAAAMASWPTPIGSHRKISYSMGNPNTQTLEPPNVTDHMYARYMSQSNTSLMPFNDLNDMNQRNAMQMGNNAEGPYDGHTLLTDETGALSDQFENMFYLDSNNTNGAMMQPNGNLGLGEDSAAAMLSQAQSQTSAYNCNALPIRNQTQTILPQQQTPHSQHSVCLKQCSTDWPPLSASNPWSAEFDARISTGSLSVSATGSTKMLASRESPPMGGDSASVTGSNPCISNLNSNNTNSCAVASNHIKHSIENDICNLLNIASSTVNSGGALVETKSISKIATE